LTPFLHSTESSRFRCHYFASLFLDFGVRGEEEEEEEERKKKGKRVE
jgi:hypothetical protein